MPNQWVEVGAKEAEEFYPIHVFNAIGDKAIGKLVDIKENIQGKFGNETHYIFTTPEGNKFGINPNPDLSKRLSVTKLGDVLRVTFVSEKDIGKASPMRIYKVERASPGGAAPAPKPAPAPAVADDDIPF